MYDMLEDVRDDLKQLQIVLKAADSGPRIARIDAAFAASAQHVSEATRAAHDEGERSALQTLYRGLLAGRRIVQRLHELQRTVTPGR
jgi:hypothetical protein